MQSMGLHRVKPPEMWSLALTMLGIEEYTKEQIHSFVNQAEHLFFDYPPVLIEDDLFQTLNTLEGMGIKMNIISNTGFITANVLKATKVVNEITSFVHHLFASDIEGIAKPNKSIFQAAQTFEIDITSSYLHVGDNLIADIQGAKNAGFHTLLYGPGRELTKLSHLPEYIKNFNDAVKCTPNPRRGESTIQ